MIEARIVIFILLIISIGNWMLMMSWKHRAKYPGVQPQTRRIQSREAIKVWAIKKARIKALEEAAIVAEVFGGAEDIAAAIRALKDKGIRT